MERYDRFNDFEDEYEDMEVIETPSFTSYFDDDEMIYDEEEYEDNVMDEEEYYMDDDDNIYEMEDDDYQDYDYDEDYLSGDYFGESKNKKKKFKKLKLIKKSGSEKMTEAVDNEEVAKILAVLRDEKFTNDEQRRKLISMLTALFGIKDASSRKIFKAIGNALTGIGDEMLDDGEKEDEPSDDDNEEKEDDVEEKEEMKEGSYREYSYVSNQKESTDRYRKMFEKDEDEK